MDEAPRESLTERLRRDPRYQRVRRPSLEAAGPASATSRDALLMLRELARDIVEERGKPYETGRVMWSTAMSAVSPSEPEGAQCHALWLLWGALTDSVERNPAERPSAEEMMRRAAREWLEVVDDESAWRAYFDRWLYDELGYKRPSSHTG